MKPTLFQKDKLHFKKYKVSKEFSIECIDSSLLFENNVIKEGNAFVANEQNSDLLPCIYEGLQILFFNMNELMN